VILLTTLETNKDQGYHAISKAPPPSRRFAQFKSLDYARKGITIEPVMDFDTELFLSWILALKLEFVYLGFNSHPKAVHLPEPSAEKFLEFRRLLQEAGFEVRDKDLRGRTALKLQ
jgi:hypothetical protein